MLYRIIFWDQYSSDDANTNHIQSQHSDVLVVSCDLVTSVPMHLLTEFHSAHHSTLTCLLSQRPTSQDDAHRKASTAAGEPTH